MFYLPFRSHEHKHSHRTRNIFYLLIYQILFLFYLLIIRKFGNPFSCNTQMIRLDACVELSVALTKIRLWDMYNMITLGSLRSDYWQTDFCANRSSDVIVNSMGALYHNLSDVLDRAEQQTGGK